MIFPDPLVRGTLLRRYKRFLADVDLETGETVTAHCANSGSMLSVDAPGSEVWLSPARNPDRKLKYTWELIRIGETLVGINTGHPNAIVAEAVAAGEIPELNGYTSARREVKYGRNSRIDLLLEGPGRPRCFVEVKNVTLRREGGPERPVEFPDAVTARGAKHLAELSNMVRDGDRAVMMYLVQREDADWFTLADDIDPAYAEAFEQATAVGVEALCYRCRVSPRDIRISQAVRISHPDQSAR
jgi:sugar fermentation stimulation protein A